MNTPEDSQDKTQLTAGGTPVACEFGPGDKVGGTYEVIAFIGAGGMGNVYRVRHTLMNTEYALKTLSADKVTEVAWKRFQNEAQAIARMTHPNIVAIYNLGFHEGRLPYYVMDLLKGTSLFDILREKGPLDINEALTIFIEVCAGIGYAHKKGIVHRDIKPANLVLVDKSDASGARVKIVDFGIAKLSHTKELASQQLTKVGEVCGSPYYMSPEQCSAGKIDARSDIYSLGCTLFEVLTGSPPFKGRNAMDTMLLHSSGTAPTLETASGGKEFPHLLELAVAKMLAKEPMDRYQNMERLAQDLTVVLHGGEAQALQPDAVAEKKFNPQMLLAAIVAILLTSSVLAIWLNGAIKKAPPVAAQIPIQTTTATGQAKNPVTAPGGKTSTTAPATAVKVQPFTSILFDKHKKPYWHFSFPADRSIGKIWTKAENQAKDCIGVVDLEAAAIQFAPNDTFISHPEYWARFGPGVIFSLVLDGVKLNEKLDNKFFENLIPLKGLACLTIKECQDIDDNVLVTLEKLPDLRVFHCEFSNISVKGLAHSSFLHRLSILTLLGDGSVTPVLEALKGSTTVNILNLQDRKNLTLYDYQLIGTMSNLHVLSCDNCGTTDAQLKALQGLKHLDAMQITQNKLTLASIPVLKEVMSAAKPGSWVHMETKNLTPAQFYLFQKGLPGLQIN